MLNYINGDITSVEDGLILHGTNCSGGFGSGVAGAIRKKWPIVYQVFSGYPTGKRMLGEFVPVRVNEKLIVANCYTQLHYGSDGKRYASPDAIKTCVLKAYKYAKHNNIGVISMPKIGAGLGGLSWENEVEPLIFALSGTFNNIKTNIYYI